MNLFNIMKNIELLPRYLKIDPGGSKVALIFKHPTPTIEPGAVKEIIPTAKLAGIMRDSSFSKIVSRRLSNLSIF